MAAYIAGFMFPEACGWMPLGSGADRYVIKYGVRVSQVKPSNCFRRLEKLVLPSIFDTSLSSLMMWNLHSYPTTVLTERMWDDF